MGSVPSSEAGGLAFSTAKGETLWGGLAYSPMVPRACKQDGNGFLSQQHSYAGQQLKSWRLLVRVNRASVHSRDRVRAEAGGVEERLSVSSVHFDGRREEGGMPLEQGREAVKTGTYGCLAPQARI